MAIESKKNLQIESSDLVDLENSSFDFGGYLRSIRQAKETSIRQLAKAIGITPTYLSDIEKGNNKPPDKALLEAIIKELHLEENKTVVSNLFDLAAKERNDIPADIKDYIINNHDLLVMIRSVKDNPEKQNIWNELSHSIG